MDKESEVPIPEEFQKKVIALIDECCSMECTDFISSCLSEKRSELYRKRNKESSPAKGMMDVSNYPED